MSKEDQPKMEMEEDHDSLHSDDDDSEYTYVTDEEEEEPAKKRGWFGFLRREKHVADDDDYESEEEEEGSHNDDGSAASDHQEDNVVPTTSAADNQDDQHSTAASASSEQEEDILDEIDKYNPPDTSQKSLPSNSQQEQQQEAEEEEEESILMAQAIQRVQQRIESHGGNIYNALEERDRVLVDTLRGVEDEDVIREVVDRAMEEEDEERNSKVGQGDDDNDDELVEENNDCINQEDDINNNNDEKEHFNIPPKIMKRDETTAATNQPSFIPQGVYVEEQPSEVLLVSKNNNENSSSIHGGSSKNDANLEEQFNGNDQGEEQGEEGEEEEHPQEEEEHDDDEDDDDEEEGPTLEEQRSLLSLAAEHDRVDVIKELLSISPNEDVNTSLLCGFSSADNDNPTNIINNNSNNDDAAKTANTPKNDNTKSHHPTNNVIFVPPPLHAAVAHGSVNAASCLLRMGANPSIRPKVPTPYLSRNYHPSPTTTSRSRSTTKSSHHMEEDRNYKKYHEMSAWELAFGSIVVLKDGDDTIDDDEEIEEEEEEVTEKRGWFGFGGGGGRHDKKDDDEVEQVTIQQQQHQDANGKQRIIRRRQPLNIAPNKLEGIRHAFTAEALRAIGADEVHRLQQLLDSGMDSKMEVAGKSLVSWAIEMEAEGCCELLRGDHNDDEIKTGSGEDVIVSPPDDSNGGSSPVVVSNSSNGDVHVAQPTKPTKNDQSTTVIAQQKPIATIHDERLTGLSPKDILMLIQENENLIPALTTCRDELAEETSACQNILRDVQASGGRGGLSSKSLLDLVHSLKERRRELEDSVKNWRHAWEEREDELDFFWEEVLNDEWREHLVQSGILDDNNDEVSDTTSSSMTSTTTASGYANASLDDLTRRFCEVDNRVNTLRSSIANLADECARYQTEFERAGMSGALSLTKSLRDELKEMESQLSEAKSGEAMCRRKIELIQERLNNSARDEPVQEQVQNNEYVDDAEEHGYEGDDSHPDGQGQEDVSNLAYDFADKELMEGTAYAEAFVHRGMEREYFQDQYEEEDDRSSASNEGAASYESDHDDRESLENESAVVDKAIEEHIGFVVVNDANEVANEADERNPSEKQEEANVVNNDDDDDETIPSEMQEVEEAAMDAPHLGNGQSHKFETNETADHKGDEHTGLNDVLNAPIRTPDSELDTLKPSDALKSGMSTALVVRQPTGRPGLSLQLWDLIRRIVGLGRTPSYRAQSESSTNIMIV